MWKNCATLVLKHYLLCYMISGILFYIVQSLGCFDYLIFPLCGYILFFNYLKLQYKPSGGICDIIVLLMFVWIVVTWIFNDYGDANKMMLIIRCLMSQVCFMLFYYIGKQTKGYIFFDDIQKPLLVCCILGLYFFFLPPSWYTAKLIESMFQNANIGAHDLLESMRLRSVFSSPYQMSYMSCIFSMFIIHKSMLSQKIKLSSFFFVCLLIVVMLLAMQRTPLLAFGISLSFAYYLYIKSHNIWLSIYHFCILLFLLIFVGYLFFLMIDTDQLEFLISKFDSVQNESGDLVSRRLTVVESDFGILGNGAGRYAIHAMKYGSKFEIRDSEFLKYLIEQGYIGISLFILLVVVCLMKCIRYLKNLSFEFCILILLLISMIGANPLTTADKHGFIFWYVIGQISVYNRKKILS